MTSAFGRSTHYQGFPQENYFVKVVGGGGGLVLFFDKVVKAADGCCLGGRLNKKCCGKPSILNVQRLFCLTWVSLTYTCGCGDVLSIITILTLR